MSAWIPNASGTHLVKTEAVVRSRSHFGTAVKTFQSVIEKMRESERRHPGLFEYRIAIIQGLLHIGLKG
jgi:hypothetical protein